MDLQKRIARNPRLLFWGQALIAAKTLTAIAVLFYQHRGVDLEHVFYLSIVWSITSLITEVPSGYLADRIGRKRTLLLGAALLITSHVLTLFAYGFWEFALVFVFMSSAYSCFSGTQEALLFESLECMGTSHDMNTHNGKQLAAGSLPDVFLPAIGALFASQLLEWQFQVLIIANLILPITAVVVLSFIQEPPHLTTVASSERGIFKESLHTLRSEPWLRKVMINKVFVFTACFIVWRAYQPIMKNLGMSLMTLAIFYSLFMTMEFLGGWYAGKIEKHISIPKIISWTAIAMALSIGIAIISNQPWIIFCAFLIPLSTNSLRSAVFSHAVNQRIPSRSRATTLSNMNVLKGAIDIILLWCAGKLSQYSLTYPLIIACALCIIVLFIAPIFDHELKQKTLKPAIST